MSYVRNGPFLIKLSFDPLLKPRLCGIRQELACRTCHDWYKSKVYFLVPDRLSKIDDLLELVREQHGIRSEISFIAAEFGVNRSLPIETLREIKEPIEVVPRGPGAPKVDFPKCNCAAAAESNHVANMIRNLNESVGGKEDENKMTGLREHATIQHPGNLVPPEGETSKADVDHRNSNASSRPEEVTPAGGFTESSGSQEEDESVGANVAAGSEMATSVQESINSKGYHDNAEAGESIECEDMGSVMDVSCKETEDGREQCYPVGDNEAAANHEECAGDEQLGYSDLEWATLSSNIGGENDESRRNGVRPDSVVRQSYTIQHPSNIGPPEGETSKADVEHRNSNASSRPEDVTPAGEFTESSGSQEEDESVGPHVASGSEMATSVQESINSKGYHDDAEAGESIGCEDMGSVMNASCKETEDANEQCYPVGVNETASNHEECAGDEQSGYSELGRAALSSNVEEIMDSQEGDDDEEMDVNDVDVKEDSSVEISDEGTRKNDSANIFEGPSKREGFDMTTEETGIPDKKSKSVSITSGCDSLSECLNSPATLAEKLIESEKNLTFDEHSGFFTSTPRFPIDTIRTSNGRPYQPQKFFDTTIAHDDQGNEAADGQNYFQEEGQESGEKLFPQT